MEAMGKLNKAQQLMKIYELAKLENKTPEIIDFLIKAYENEDTSIRMLAIGGLHWDRKHLKKQNVINTLTKAAMRDKDNDVIMLAFYGISKILSRKETIDYLMEECFGKRK